MSERGSEIIGGSAYRPLVNQAVDTTERQSVEEMAGAFQAAVIALRRVARRHARQNMPALPPSETELLTLVAEMKGIGVNEAARILQVSPSTVSMLVRALTRRGLLERLSDPSDRRAALLHLTGAGAARKEQTKRLMVDSMTNAILALGADDRRVLACAVPAMQRLLAELEKNDPAKQV